ncbi:myb family transcription factor EFM-like isoform X2 [Camellia sinensis]|uniref:myb family transcription factor EFM-like isoform X2 n=1 Tax=Camellia sinensis TaxID=4442 RepID=UPI0010359B69|nr:myb family transcription factor EFM-like isoform X2 [Camellia sinensis]
MMASPSELSLDCKPHHHSYSMLLKSLGDHTDHTQNLEDFLSQLEEERLKIDAFKRELPLCMQLLTNAMETSRQQLQTYRANQGPPRPVLEEFIPLKHSSSVYSEKANMFDLWSQASDGPKPQSAKTSPKETEIGFGGSPPKLALDNKPRNGGAFHPFSKERKYSCPSPTLRSLPDLALASVDEEMEDKKCSEVDNGITCSRRENLGKPRTGVIEQVQGGSVQTDTQTTTVGTGTTTTTSQTHRKARRCWSPELHRRFVNALQVLGGSQVATPKQIRELMKVDGLTNDEVKSHLQTAYQTTMSQPTSCRHRTTPGSVLRRHMGPIRVRHCSSSGPRWCTTYPVWCTPYHPCLSTLLSSTTAPRVLYRSTTTTIAPPHPPPPAPHVQGLLTEPELPGF